MYRFTLSATQQRDAPSASIDWLRSAFINPHYTRQLMYWLPTVLSGGLPPHLQPLMLAMSQAFGARPLTDLGDVVAD
jgi:hypothetical protein